MPEKLHELEQIRLTRDWSYRELGEHIFLASGIRRNQDCWRKICQGETEAPQGGTKYALNKFLLALATGNNGTHGGRRRRVA